MIAEQATDEAQVILDEIAEGQAIIQAAMDEAKRRNIQLGTHGGFTPQAKVIQSSPVEFKPLTTPAVKILDDYAGRIASDDLPQLLRLGPALDGIEVGPELLAIFGAPPGAGKTACSSQIAFEAVDLNPELRVYIANAEMSFEALLRRQLTKITRIKSDTIRFGRLDEEQQTQVKAACDELRPKLERFGIIENPGLHSLKSLLEEPPGLVIVDYLQKFSPPDKEPRLGVNMVVTTLRELAQAGHAILALSATKRDVNGGHASKQLTLSSFKESGEVEFNADSAYVLRDEGPIDEGCQYIRKITLAHLKNRHGAKVDRDLEFHMPRMEFSRREPDAFEEFAEYAGDSMNPFGGSS